MTMTEKSDSQDPLLEAVSQAWGLTGKDQKDALRNVLERDREGLARCHALMSLVMPEDEVRRWAATPLQGGRSPISMLLSEPEALARMEARLARAFFAVEPPGLLRPETPEEDRDGAAGEPDWEGRAGVLMQALLRRSRLAFVEDWVLLDPRTGSPVPDASLRLSDALQSHWTEADGPCSRFLIELALTDADRMIRMCAARSSVGFLGHREVADAVGRVCSDADPQVRLAAVRTLATFAIRPEIRRRLYAFARDTSVEIRRLVARALSPRVLPCDEQDAIAPLAFDPDADVAAAVRSAVSPDRIAAVVRAMAEEAAAGGEMCDYDLYVIARSDTLSAAEREDAVVSRLAALMTAPRRPKREPARTIQSVRWWNGEVPARVWSAAAQAVEADATSDAALDRALAACLPRATGPEGWRLTLAAMRRDFAGASGLRGLVAGRAAELAGGDSARIEALIGFSCNPFLHDACVFMAIEALGRLVSPAERRMGLLGVLRCADPAGPWAGIAARELVSGMEASAVEALVRSLENAGDGRTAGILRGIRAG